MNALYNSGIIASTLSSDSGTAAAIVDRSGTLALVQNNGAIGVTNTGLGDTGIAIDLSANTSGAIVRQIAASSGRPDPTIYGKILSAPEPTRSTSRQGVFLATSILAVALMR